jgi:protein-L-isoaspartate(D-aspartate) O-methyltransferase
LTDLQKGSSFDFVITILALSILVCSFIALLSASYSGNGASGGAVSEETQQRLRERMVERQIALRVIKNQLVLDAMRKVKRHEFVSPSQQAEAYEDGPLPIGQGQTISQPYVVALMTELARVAPHSKVLEIGTGCGYQTAVLAEIAREVYSIELIEDLGKVVYERLSTLGYKNVHLRIGDGYQGWPEAAPFDAIIVTAAPDHIPQPLLDQLQTGGRMIVPIGDFYQELEVVTKTETGIKRERTIPVRFVPMRGKAQRQD